MIRRTLPLLTLLASGLFAQPASWTTPFPPHKVAGNLYYVGSQDLAAYLVTTPQGHILINSNLESSVPQIEASVEKLGFRFTDIKYLLVSHAHWDHCAGSAAILKRTGARYLVMEPDVREVEAGGRYNFQYGNDPATRYPPAKVDRILHDGDEVRLGDTVLTAHWTPGHTKGCTTWSMKVREGGRDLNAVIVGSPNVNPGYQLFGNAAYPRMDADFSSTFDRLLALPCDIFLGAHGQYYDLAGKYPRIAAGGTNPFIDPAGFRTYVLDRQKAYREERARQAAAREKPAAK